MNKFEIGKTYFTRSICDHNCIFEETIVSRTAKTIKTSSGKTLRVNDKFNGIEQIWPEGKYSMAPIISADRIK